MKTQVKNTVGYFLAGLLGTVLGSALPALHAQGGYSPELREIFVNGQKLTPKNGAIQITLPASVAQASGDQITFWSPYTGDLQQIEVNGHKLAPKDGVVQFEFTTPGAHVMVPDNDTSKAIIWSGQ